MNDNWENLRADLDSVRQRFDVLEKQLTAPQPGRRTVLTLTVLATVLAFAVFGGRQAGSYGQQSSGPLHPPAGQAPKAVRDLVCTSLKIVGPDGKERVVLGDTDNGGYASVHGSDGKVRAVFWTKSGKYGRLSLRDGKEIERVVATGNTKGGVCQFYGPTGHHHVYFGTSGKKDFGLVYLGNPYGEHGVEFSHATHGGYVRVNGHEGKTRALLGLTQSGKNGLLQLFNEVAECRMFAGADQDGGYLDLVGSNGKSQAMLECDKKHGGSLHLYTAKNKSMFFAAGNANSGDGQFQLLGTDNKARIDLFVNANDEGMIWGSDGQQVTRWLK